MVFSSIPFLYYFLPCFFVLYYVMPKKCRNVILVLSSLIFYGWGEPIYIVLMLASILISYVFGLFIAMAKSVESSPRNTSAKIFLLLGILIHVGILLYFKYTDFAISSVNNLFPVDIPLRKIALPLGISFYTFQILSYLIDLYYGRIQVQKNFFHYAAYVSMFPQLVAGPIVRYQDIEASLRMRTITANDVADGITRFIIGLSKKVILADNLGKIEQFYFTTTDTSVLYVWLYAIAYTLQIYFDFSGYSDMAIGLGKMLGFHFPENFDHPYESRSITEFWRRWHMTLGGWFRDYIYIPLGGKRVGKARFIINIMIVWALTGLWHGAAWNFVLWGLYYGILLLLEKFLWKKYLENDNLLGQILSHCYVILITILGFVLFNGSSLRMTANTILAMFGGMHYNVSSAEAIYYLRSYAVLLILGICFATSLPAKLLQTCQQKLLNSKIKSKNLIYGIGQLLKILILLGSLILCTAFIVDETFHPFLYFRF